LNTFEAPTIQYPPTDKNNSTLKAETSHKSTPKAYPAKVENITLMVKRAFVIAVKTLNNEGLETDELDELKIKFLSFFNRVQR
jgi:hypothetical protein